MRIFPCIISIIETPVKRETYLVLIKEGESFIVNIDILEFQNHVSNNFRISDLKYLSSNLKAEQWELKYIFKNSNTPLTLLAKSI